MKDKIIDLPRLLVGKINCNLQEQAIVFEQIKSGQRASAKVHWLFKPSDADGSAAAIINYQPGGSAPPHIHNGYELIYILDGEMNTSTGLVKKNDLVLLEPGTIHSSSSDVGCIAIILWLKEVEVLGAY